MDELPADIPQPEIIYGSALYLSASYARTGCPMVSRMVMHQLACIANHPSGSVPESLREICRKLHAEWSRIGAERALALHAAASADAPEPGQMH